MWKDRGGIFPIIVRYLLEYDRRHKGGVSLKDEAKRRVGKKELFRLTILRCEKLWAPASSS